jgi:hypothetical protein
MLLQKSLMLALGLATVLCTGCGTLNKLKRKSKEEKPAETANQEPARQDTAIGLVEMVNPEQQFVLVRTEGRMSLLPGTKLITQPQTGNKATLIVTPESKQNFISADIVEGFPKRGDVVILPVAGQPQPLGAAAASPGPSGQPGPEAMVPGVMPGHGGIQPPAFSSAPAPQPAPVAPPPPPARPVQKAPSIKVPTDVKGSLTAPVDPLPPPDN